MMTTSQPDVLVIGAGMIVYDQILPSLYHLQRLGQIGELSIVATSAKHIKKLISERFAQAFPGQQFKAFPSINCSEMDRNIDLWRERVSSLPSQSLVVVATPDETHDSMVRHAIACDQHVLCVKPLVHRYDQS